MMSPDLASSARYWQEALAEWAVPEEILRNAPETPWGYSTDRFVRAAERAMAAEEASPSIRAAREALPAGGSVLDVGAGAGAGSLPLVPPAAFITAVDEQRSMLEVFAGLAEKRAARHAEIVGRWPEVAAEAPPADVAVCHHVLYNVADLPPFVEALTSKARHRVVVEITASHPLSRLSPLFERFHGVKRPTRPTARDAADVLAALGYEVREDRFTPAARSSWATRDDQVAFARKILCVGLDRDDEIGEYLDSLDPAVGRETVTLSWPGRASA
jgi:precorrin-6B methylase 2